MTNITFLEEQGRKYLACEDHVETLWRLANVNVLATRGLREICGNYELTEAETAALYEIASEVARTASALKLAYYGKANRPSAEA